MFLKTYLSYTVLYKLVGLELCYNAGGLNAGYQLYVIYEFYTSKTQKRVLAELNIVIVFSRFYMLFFCKWFMRCVGINYTT